MDDCHECVLRVSLDDHFGMSDVSCECGQTATCKRISVPFLLKSHGNHLFVYCVSGQIFDSDAKDPTIMDKALGTLP